MVLKVVRRFGVLGVERWRWSSWSTACCSRGDLRCRSSIPLISHRSSYLVVSSLRVPGFSVLVQLPCSGSLALSASSVVFSWSWWWLRSCRVRISTCNLLSRLYRTICKIILSVILMRMELVRFSTSLFKECSDSRHFKTSEFVNTWELSETLS